MPEAGFTIEDRRLAALESARWHLDKRIPISIIAFMAIQTIALVVFLTRLDSRVDFQEKSNVIQDARIEKIENISPRIAVMEEKLSNITIRLDIQTARLNQIIEIIGKK